MRVIKEVLREVKGGGKCRLENSAIITQNRKNNLKRQANAKSNT